MLIGDHCCCACGYGAGGICGEAMGFRRLLQKGRDEVATFNQPLVVRLRLIAKDYRQPVEVRLTAEQAANEIDGLRIMLDAWRAGNSKVMEIRDGEF